jgi:hypothetical protein
MKKRTVIIIIAVAVLVLAAAIVVHQFRVKAAPYYWRTASLEKGDMASIVTATGSVAADTSVDVGVQVSGTIARINVDFNNVVKKGQVIALLDTTLFYAAKLDAAAALQRAQASFDEAGREFNRTKNLFENKVVAQADYDLGLTAFQTAKGNLVSAKEEVPNPDSKLIPGKLNDNGITIVMVTHEPDIAQFAKRNIVFKDGVIRTDNVVGQLSNEIGIRMAIGAKGRDVLLQFMIESMVMSFAGGLIGIALGMIAARMIAAFGGWPVVITLSSILLSFAFSAVVGVFFGWYPARKAAALNPIEALRYE